MFAYKFFFAFARCCAIAGLFVSLCSIVAVGGSCWNLFFFILCVHSIWWWSWGSACEHRNLFTRWKSYKNRLHSDKFQSRFSFSNGTIYSLYTERGKRHANNLDASVYTRTQTTPLKIIFVVVVSFGSIKIQRVAPRSEVNAKARNGRMTANESATEIRGRGEGRMKTAVDRAVYAVHSAARPFYSIHFTYIQNHLDVSLITLFRVKYNCNRA